MALRYFWASTPGDNADKERETSKAGKIKLERVTCHASENHGQSCGSCGPLAGSKQLLLQQCNSCLFATRGAANPASAQPTCSPERRDYSSDDTICFKTTFEAVEQMLGMPRSGLEIPCLSRSMVWYPDGTKICFFKNRVISVIGGTWAAGDSVAGYIIFRNDRRIFVDPQVIFGSQIPLPPPLDIVKSQVDVSILHVPPAPPPPPMGPRVAPPSQHEPLFFPVKPSRLF